MKSIPFSISAGLIAALIGLVAFAVSWNFYEFWGGPMPGYRILLFPGNLSLVYVWHPLFTEEVNLYPKLALILLGQFLVVAGVVELVRFLARKLFGVAK